MPNEVTNLDYLLGKPLLDCPYVIFDFETTGLSADDDAIIEIGAVRLEQGHVVDRFSALIDPMQPIPPEASRINNIDDQMVQGQPTLPEVFPKFLSFSQQAVFCAHNAAFDVRFLGAACKRFKIRSPEVPVVDTLALSRKLYPAESTHSLQALCQRLGLENQEAHRAQADAEVTASVLQRFLENLSKRGLMVVGDLLSFQDLAIEIKGARSGYSLEGYVAEQAGPGLFG